MMSKPVKKVSLLTEKDLEKLPEGEWVFVEKSNIGFRVVMERDQSIKAPSKKRDVNK